MKAIFNVVLISLLAFLSIQVVAYSDDEQNQQRGERRGPPAFTELDLDGDGSLTLAEFQEHKIPRGDHETVFNHIDSDSDGVISEDEMTNHKPPRRQRN